MGKENDAFKLPHGKEVEALIKQREAQRIQHAVRKEVKGRIQRQK